MCLFFCFLFFILFYQLWYTRFWYKCVHADIVGSPSWTLHCERFAPLRSKNRAQQKELAHQTLMLFGANETRACFVISTWAHFTNAWAIELILFSIPLKYIPIDWTLVRIKIRKGTKKLFMYRWWVMFFRWNIQFSKSTDMNMMLNEPGLGICTPYTVFQAASMIPVSVAETCERGELYFSQDK